MLGLKLNNVSKSGPRTSFPVVSAQENVDKSKNVPRYFSINIVAYFRSKKASNLLKYI